jgi:hypothetical protein
MTNATAYWFKVLDLDELPASWVKTMTWLQF